MFTRLLPSGVATLALLATTLVAAPAQAEPTTTPARAAGAWLESQLTDGLIHNEQFGFDDIGLTIDTAYALRAVGMNDQRSTIVDAVTANAAGYVGLDWGDYGGSIGKMASFARDIAEADPANFGGLDLIAELEDLTADDGPLAGRVTHEDSFGDYAGSINQTWATRALGLESSPEFATALQFLLQQQCDAGFFRNPFSAKDAADQTCDGANGAPDLDATAFAIILLHDLTGEPGADGLSAALASAADWLESRQGASGAYASAEGPNSNTTGVVGWALQELGRDAAAAKAASWVRRNQVPGTQCSANLASAAGAVAYQSPAIAAGRVDGIEVPAQDQWRRSTAQAAVGLRAAPPATADLAVLGPQFVRAGQQATVRLRGLAPGERGCVKTGKSLRTVFGDATMQLPVRKTTGGFVVVLQSAEETVTRELVALAPASVHFTRRAILNLGVKQRVVVSGVWPGEMIKVRRNGKLVARGAADADGRFVTEFAAGGRKYHTVQVQGHFGNTRSASKLYLVQ